LISIKALFLPRPNMAPQYWVFTFAAAQGDAGTRLGKVDTL